MTVNAVQEAEFPEIRVRDVKRHLVFQPNLGWAFAFCFLILVLRNELHEVFYPLLYNEDGRNIFGLFYNDHSIKNIFTSYSGYYQVFPRLAGYILHFLPVTWVPSLYGLFALSFSALAYSLFFPLLNRLFHSPWFALYSVLILTALPLASHKLVGALMFQVWNGVIILGVVVFLPIPKKYLGKALYFFAINVLIWSHPYCILVLPIYLYKLAFQKDNRWVYGFFSLSVFVYFGLTLSHHPLNWDSLLYFPSSLLGRVATETVVGPLNRAWFQYLEISLIFGFLMIAFVGCTIGFSWKKMKRNEKWFYGVAAYFVVTTMAVALLGRELGDYYHLINGSPRYTYLPRITFLMMLMAALFRLYQISTVFRITHWVLAALVLTINLNGNVRYKTDLQVGQSVRDYVAYLDQNPLDCAPGEERWFTLHRGGWQNPGTPGDWSIPANLCHH
jgi:hypothetical protein